MIPGLFSICVSLFVSCVLCWTDRRITHKATQIAWNGNVFCTVFLNMYFKHGPMTNVYQFKSHYTSCKDGCCVIVRGEHEFLTLETGGQPSAAELFQMKTLFFCVFLVLTDPRPALLTDCGRPLLRCCLFVSMEALKST